MTGHYFPRQEEFLSQKKSFHRKFFCSQENNPVTRKWFQQKYSCDRNYSCYRKQSSHRKQFLSQETIPVTGNKSIIGNIPGVGKNSCHKKNYFIRQILVTGGGGVRIPVTKRFLNMSVRKNNYLREIPVILVTGKIPVTGKFLKSLP